MIRNAIALVFGILVSSVLSLATQAQSTVTEQDAYEIGVEAYTYLYPLVLMDATRRQAVNVEAGKAIGRGPMNVFTHVPIFPPADFGDVVRPNFDTLYSIAWLDLTKEPMVVAVPDTQGRYYMLPMLDMWTDVFACPGKRTTGTGACPLRGRATRLAGQASARHSAHRRAHALRLDHRAHPDQRRQGLRSRPQGAGWLHDHAAFAVGQDTRASEGRPSTRAWT